MDHQRIRVKLVGVQQILLAGGGVITYNVSVTFSSGSTYGYVSGSLGSVSPSPIATPLGSNTITVAETGSTVDFVIDSATVPASQTSLFTGLYVQDSTGTIRNYTSASATYGSGTWSWGTGSSPAWTAAGNRILTIS
jgi:hypothetical protein